MSTFVNFTVDQYWHGITLRLLFVLYTEPGEPLFSQKPVAYASEIEQKLCFDWPLNIFFPLLSYNTVRCVVFSTFSHFALEECHFFFNAAPQSVIFQSFFVYNCSGTFHFYHLLLFHTFIYSFFTLLVNQTRNAKRFSLISWSKWEQVK